MQEQIQQLQKELEDLKRQVYRNQFSDLFVFPERVQFKNDIIFPKDETSIATSTTDSTGKIAIKDETGAVRYIPYFS